MAVHRKQYWIVFIWLFVLTALEIAAVYVIPNRALLASALVAMAVSKATLVALYFMHLSTETRTLRLVVGVPLLVPPFYAVVLMAEATVRLVWPS